VLRFGRKLSRSLRNLNAATLPILVWQIGWLDGAARWVAT